MNSVIGNTTGDERMTKQRMTRASPTTWTKSAVAICLYACVTATVTSTTLAEDRPAATDDRARHAADVRKDVRTDPLLILIVTWLATNYGLPANFDLPQVAFVSAERIAEMRWGPGADLRGQREVVAVYHDKRNTIYLPDGWTGRSPAEVSVIVHEMVHHLQKKAGHSFLCPEGRERMAYDAQEKWLGLFGLSLASEFQIDPFTVKVATSCL